jgi:hypothetical protein
VAIAAARRVVFCIPYSQLGGKCSAHSITCAVIRQNICLWGTSRGSHPMGVGNDIAFAPTLQIAPASTFPVFMLVIYDWPRDHPIAYQVVLSISIWGWCVLELR